MSSQAAAVVEGGWYRARIGAAHGHAGASIPPFLFSFLVSSSLPTILSRLGSPTLTLPRQAVRRAAMLALLLGSLALGRRVAVAIHGLSVSPTGFVALLRSSSPDRVLPLPICPSDVESVSSPEALTLLQLWQAIDMAGPMLPPEKLNRLVEADDARLLQVRVGATSDCQLLVAARGSCIECDVSAFEGIALCLRYGAQLVAEIETLEGPNSIAGVELDAKYPSCFTREDAAAQQKRLSDELHGNLAASGMRQSPPRNANTPPRELLMKALTIARDRGDLAAAAKIEEKLREADGDLGDAVAHPLERLKQQMREFEGDGNERG